MRGTAPKLALLWLIASQVVFLVEMRVAAGEAWVSPFGPVARAAARIPGALRVWGSGAEPGLALPFLGMLAVGAAAFAGATGLGLAAFRFLGWRRGGALAVLLAAPAGWLPVAAAVEGAGLCGIVRPAAARVAVALLVIAGLRTLPVLRSALGGLPPPGRRWGWLIAAAVLLVSLPAIAPERNTDALIYHLPVPCWYLETGRITARPDWAFAGLAQNQELLSYAALAAWFDERWAKVLSILAAGWLAVLVVARGGAAPWAGRAALLLLTAPILAEVAGTGKNDVSFALAVFSALLAVERGLAAGATAPVAAAGWLCGAAYGVKNFGVFAALALAVTLAADPRMRRRVAAWVALAAPAALAVLPHASRNWLTLGSPAYPFLLSSWTPVGWTAGKLEMMRVVFNARTFPVGSPGQLAASPLHALAHASPFILACLPLGVASAAVRAAHRPGLVFAAAWFAGWAVLPTGGVVRFLLPLLPTAFLVACAAADESSGVRRRVASALLALAVGVQAVAVLAGPAWESAPLGAATGREGLAGFRVRTAPVWSEALGWLEGRGTAAVVGQGVQYPRPTTVRLLGHEIEQAMPLRDLVRESRDTDELAKRVVRQRRIRFVLYNLTAANFWAKYAERFPWSPRDAEVYRRFWLERARLVRVSTSWSASEGLILLYRLDASAGAGTKASLFLPGTEAVFSVPRQAYFHNRPVAELLGMLEPYRRAFDGILSFPAREAFCLLVWGQPARAAVIIRGIWPRLDPLERKVCRICGLPAASGALEAWLAAKWSMQALRNEEIAALFFNVGLPPALPPR